MPRQPIHTEHAPAAIGPYSQAVRAGGTVYLSGQIPLDPATGSLVEGDMAEYFASPYPARSTVEVPGLPKGATFEVDAVMVLG